MKDFTDLRVWQEAHKLTLMVYKATQKWPREEQFGLTLQARRSSGSVGSNIAEGFGRFTQAEFHHFCNIAKGSLFETQNHLLVARDLRYMTPDEWKPIDEQAVTVRQLLQGLMRTLRPG
jgi:four helix bundle protein